MKRIIALILSCSLILSGCTFQNNSTHTSDTEQVVSNTTEEVSQVDIPEDEVGDDSDYTYEVNFDSMDDDLISYVEDSVYLDLVNNLNSEDYLVENVSAVYISQEYIDEVAYNSQSNIYFGYTLAELEEQYTDSKYVFTLGKDGQTVAQPFEDYDDTYEKVLENVAIGTGLILVCVTVSVTTGGVGAPAISMIFAASAKTGTVMALSSGIISGIATGIVTGIQTHDFDEAVDAAALSGSEGFKWGAITGVITGGASKVIALKGATLNGLTMNEAAIIQKESGFPIEIIKQFHTTGEYEVFKEAGLKSVMVNGKAALVRGDIDLNLVDEFERTNLERMNLGLSPIDSNGASYELHHLGQKANASLAILTQSEHDNAFLHGYKTISEIDRKAFRKQRTEFWKTMAKLLESGAI